MSHQNPMDLLYTRAWKRDCLSISFCYIQGAVLLVSMCDTHVCVSKISVCWMYEMAASRSDGTGLPKHATLYITYNTIGCTACVYETYPYWNNYSNRNGSQNVVLFFFFHMTKKLR
jgi:hypothetical protein